MLYDPNSLFALPPHGDPAPAAKFREEFYNTPQPKTPRPEATDPRLTQNSRDLREQVIARVGRFFV
ncbi:MAG: hypothetical protein IH609_07885 [Dehalococcoidia bacterium]|nr:hypothetical protein [Dehalococcoidia bacterium]